MSPAGVRPAHEADAEAIAAIHNQGIAERTATFETRPTEPGRVEELITHWILYLVHEGAADRASAALCSPLSPTRRPNAATTSSPRR